VEARQGYYLKAESEEESDAPHARDVSMVVLAFTVELETRHKAEDLEPDYDSLPQWADYYANELTTARKEWRLHTQQITVNSTQLK